MMIKPKPNRSVLATLIVLVPALLLSYYEMAGSKKMGMPGVVTVLTKPIFAPGKEKTEPSPKPIKLKKVAKKDRQPEQENKSEPQVSEKQIKIAASDSSRDAAVIDSAKDKNKLAINAVEEKRKTKKRALHQGKTQEGLLLPNLHLEADEAAVKELLRNGDGFLLAEIEGQRYVLGVTDRDNPYRNAQVGYLADYPMISDRYLALPGGHFNMSDFEALNDSVIRRTGSRKTPLYKLVFSRNYNKYLIDVQLTKVRDWKLDLEKLREKQKNVSIYGELHREDAGVRLRVTTFEVGGKTS